MKLLILFLEFYWFNHGSKVTVPVARTGLSNVHSVHVHMRPHNVWGPTTR